MTATEAIEICRLKAGELNTPWSSDHATARRRRILPFPAFWRVVSHIKSENATVTMNVYELTREAKPIRALWAVDEPARVQPRLVFLFVFKLILFGSLIWVVDRYPGHQPIWKATLISIPGSLAGVIFWEMLDARIRMRDDKGEETDATDQNQDR